MCSGPQLTWPELDASEAQVIVSTSVQSSWVHSVIFSATGAAHNLTHSSFTFKTIDGAVRKDHYESDPTPTKSI